MLDTTPSVVRFSFQIADDYLKVYRACVRVYFRWISAVIASNYLILYKCSAKKMKNIKTKKNIPGKQTVYWLNFIRGDHVLLAKTTDDLGL